MSGALRAAIEAANARTLVVDAALAGQRAAAALAAAHGLALAGDVMAAGGVGSLPLPLDRLAMLGVSRGAGEAEAAFALRLVAAAVAHPSAAATAPATAASAPPSLPLAFGPHTLWPSQIFYASRATVAFVNIRPIVPGHVLVSPRRRVPRLSLLYPDELADLWAVVQGVGAALEAHYRGDALNVAVQDGAAAGQSVAHVHAHILPRRCGDMPLESADEIYDLIDGSERGQATAVAAGAAVGHSLAVDPRGGGSGAASGAAGSSRAPSLPTRLRTADEMAAEAMVLRRLFDAAWLTSADGGGKAPDALDAPIAAGGRLVQDAAEAVATWGSDCVGADTRR